LNRATSVRTRGVKPMRSVRINGTWRLSLRAEGFAVASIPVLFAVKLFPFPPYLGRFIWDASSGTPYLGRLSNPGLLQ
jgi:hypothetical protein